MELLEYLPIYDAVEFGDPCTSKPMDEDRKDKPAPESMRFPNTFYATGIVHVIHAKICVWAK